MSKITVLPKKQQSARARKPTGSIAGGGKALPTHSRAMLTVAMLSAAFDMRYAYRSQRGYDPEDPLRPNLETYGKFPISHLFDVEPSLARNDTA